MPKQKTHKGLQKRVKVSARGKVICKRPGSGHLMTGKSGTRRQRLRRAHEIVGALGEKARVALRVN